LGGSLGGATSCAALEYKVGKHINIGSLGGFKGGFFLD